MGRHILKSLLLLLGAGLLALVGVSNAAGAELPSTSASEGPSDYRMAQAHGDKLVESCRQFEPKYVQDHVIDGRLKIRNGDRFHVFLRNASMHKVRGWGDYGEVAILLNGFANQKVAPATNADYGRLVFYSERVKEASGINGSFLPGIVVDRADGGTFLLSVTIVEFNSKGNAILKSMLSGLSSIGSLSSGPGTLIATQLLNTLGNNFVSANTASRTLFHRIGFSIENAEPKIRQPILREGDLVVVTRKDGSVVEWEKLHYNHRNGQLYLDSECKSSADSSYSYVVLTIRRGLGRSAEELSQESLDAAINRAVANENRITAMADPLAKSVADHAATKAANRHFSEIRSSNPEVGRDALDAYVTTIWCSLSPKPESAKCAGTTISNRGVVDILRRRLLESGVFCKAHLDSLATITDAAELKALIGKGVIAKEMAKCSEG